MFKLPLDRGRVIISGSVGREVIFCSMASTTVHLRQLLIVPTSELINQFLIVPGGLAEHGNAKLE